MMALSRSKLSSACVAGLKLEKSDASKELSSE